MSMKKLKNVGNAFPTVISYLLFLVGACAVIYGCHLIYRPLAFLVGGVLVGTGGFLAAIAPAPFDEEW